MYYFLFVLQNLLFGGGIFGTDRVSDYSFRISGRVQMCLEIQYIVAYIFEGFKHILYKIKVQELTLQINWICMLDLR